MSNTITPSNSTAADLAAMHEAYRSGGEERARAPHVIYQNAECPHSGCHQHMQAIDFRLEGFGRAVHDTLVRALWADTGFAGRCPACHGWIHFTIRGKQPIAAEEAAKLPQLPATWFEVAAVL